MTKRTKQTKTTIELYESLKPGDRLRYFYQVGNINNRTLHVRRRVDNILIVRRWNKRRGWIYETMNYWGFDIPYSCGSLKIIRSKEAFNEDDQSGAPNE